MACFDASVVVGAFGLFPAQVLPIGHVEPPYFNGTPTTTISTVVIMSSRVISDSQFAASVNAGGATRRIADNTKGPESGFYVATPKHEKQINRAVTSTDVAAHKASVVAKDGNTTGYQGGWNDAGERFLDKSVRVHSPALAHSLGTIWNQRAAYNANTGKDLLMSSPAPKGRAVR